MDDYASLLGSGHSLWVGWLEIGGVERTELHIGGHGKMVFKWEGVEFVLKFLMGVRMWGS